MSQEFHPSIAAAAGGGAAATRRSDDTATGGGRTRIADAVVARIATLAALEIPGVHGLARDPDQRPRPAYAAAAEPAPAGVSVEVGEREATVDLTLVTAYGHSIIEITEAVRRNVVGQIEGMTGLTVAEVNITVSDLHLDTGPGGAAAAPS